MSFRRWLVIAGISVGALAGLWALLPQTTPGTIAEEKAQSDRPVLYYRDPSGAPYWSAIPKKDAAGRDYLPAYEDAQAPAIASDKQASAPPSGSKRILYYRNPMGLPDTSPVPRKDWMGMDYIPVYEGEEQDDGTVKVSLDKIQRTGVRTTTASLRRIVRPIRAAGTVKPDENRITVVTMRSDGYVEEVFVNTTGQHVEAGQPLFRVYSPEIQNAQIDLLGAMRSATRGTSEGARSIEGPMQRLRNLGVSETRIKEVRETGSNPRTLDWLAPATGDVVQKRIMRGQRIVPGEELYRIVDHSRVWVIADVPEADLMWVKVGTPATVTLRAEPAQPMKAEVSFIYPELRAETRSARLRIEIPNADGNIKADMYADVVLDAAPTQAEVVGIPENAAIDSGTRQFVLVAKGEGRFEPRRVKLGRRGEGYLEVIEGLSAGEEVVTNATFLIDAESNLKAALSGFSQESAK
jgi:membrane fusion protein, copper/silver efflux system